MEYAEWVQAITAKFPGAKFSGSPKDLHEIEEDDVVVLTCFCEARAQDGTMLGSWYGEEDNWHL